MRQECLEHDQRIVALVSMIRHIEVRLKQQQQQSVGRGLIALEDIIRQTEVKEYAYVPDRDGVASAYIPVPLLVKLFCSLSCSFCSYWETTKADLRICIKPNSITNTFLCFPNLSLRLWTSNCVTWSLQSATKWRLLSSC